MSAASVNRREFIAMGGAAAALFLADRSLAQLVQTTFAYPSEPTDLTIALGLYTYGLIAKWYLVPWMDSVPRAGKPDRGHRSAAMGAAGFA